MNAETMAKALGGRKIGAVWMARCPAHDDREPSLSITEAHDGKVLVCCHAQCEQASVVSALRARGLWGLAAVNRAPAPGRESRRADVSKRCAAERTEAALAIWRDAKPGAGTPAQKYLAERGLHLSIPPSLRFHPGLKHPSGGLWPAMVALVTRGADGTPMAIHRTFLAPAGSGKAPVAPPKMMLGPCRGGAVQLGAPQRLMMVGEGIETCLAAMQATGYPTWAALSTSGLRSLEVPAVVNEIIVLADGDQAGEAAARDCATRWKQEGRRACIARPPWGYDFNDVLLGDAPLEVEDAA